MPTFTGLLRDVQISEHQWITEKPSTPIDLPDGAQLGVGDDVFNTRGFCIFEPELAQKAVSLIGQRVIIEHEEHTALVFSIDAA